MSKARKMRITYGEKKPLPQTPGSPLPLWGYKPGRPDNRYKQMKRLPHPLTNVGTSRWESAAFAPVVYCA